MVRIGLIIAAVVGGALFLRWLFRQPRATQLRWGLYIAAGIVIVLALTGRIHWLGAAFAALLVLAKKIFLLAGYLPTALSWLFRLKRARDAGGATGERRAGQPGAARAMSHDEALRILNLQRGATREEIVAAHKRLMQKMHPDRGGSDHLAKQINRAKERLLEDLDS